MGIIMIIFLTLLFIWFFGCIKTYKIGKCLLVEGMGIHSAEFIMLILYSIGIITYFLYKPIGQWILVFVLLFWLIVQFFCHWYFTIFGVTQEKLKGYNTCFENTIHIIKSSNNKLIPDLYHMILHLLIIINIILLAIIIIKR